MIYEDFKLSIPKIDTINLQEHYSIRKDCYNWEVIKDFPSKNLVKGARFIIERYSTEGSHVCDPMCGIGTYLVESLCLNRNAYGFDIYHAQVEETIHNCRLAQSLYPHCGKFRVIQDTGGEATKYFASYTMDLVLFSPPYGKQNHQTGRTEKQAKFRDENHLRSCQLYSRGEDELEQDVSSVKNLKQFYAKMEPILEAAVELIKIGGYMVVTLQDYIRNGKPVGLVQRFIDMILHYPNMSAIGYHLRPLVMTKFKQMQVDRGNNVVGCEHMLVFQKGRK